MDYAKDLIWLLFDMTGPPFPPYLLEVVLIDGRSFYIHSDNVRDESTKSIVLNVYDFRALSPEDEKIVKEKLTNISWEDNPSISELHPLLDYGRLRLNLDDIAYVVEWHKYKLWSSFNTEKIEKKFRGLINLASID